MLKIYHILHIVANFVGADDVHNILHIFGADDVHNIMHIFGADYVHNKAKKDIMFMLLTFSMNKFWLTMTKYF